MSSAVSQQHNREHDMKRMKRRLIIVILIATIFMIAEVVGGIIARSLAIVADAAHILSDISGFIVSLIAIKLSSRKANSHYTYGFWQSEVVGALISIMIIWTTTIILFVEAIKRFITPEDVEGVVMFSLAVAGLVVNVIMMIVLGHNHSHGHSHGHNHSHGHSHGHNHSHGHSHAHSEHVSCEDGGNEGHESDHTNNHHRPPPRRRRIRNLALDAAFIHIIGDLVQSIGVIIAAVLIWWKPFDIGYTSDGISHWNYFDPICTIIFSILVLLTTYRTLRRSLSALMQKAPEDVDVTGFAKRLKNIQYVQCVHDVHVWNVGSANAICTAHIALQGCHNCGTVLTEAKKVAQELGISHSTFQLEASPENFNSNERKDACCHRDSCYAGESTCDGSPSEVDGYDREPVGDEDMRCQV